MDLLQGLSTGVGRAGPKAAHLTEKPTSTMALMGLCTSLLGRLSTLIGRRFTEFALTGRFSREDFLENSPLSKGPPGGS